MDTRDPYLFGLALLLAACSSSDATLSSLDTPTCGAPGPAHVFPASESVQVIGRAGERDVVAIGGATIEFGNGMGGVEAARVATIDECGEDPQMLPEGGEIHVGPERLWVVQGERVGHWPVAGGGAVTWESDAGFAAGLVPGRGFVVVDPATQVAELLPGDGTRQTLLPSVSIDEMLDPARRVERFAAVGNVLGFLDDLGSLHVVDVDDPSSAHVVADVASFVLGPDGSWFITRRGAPAYDNVEVLRDGEVTFHVRGGAETIPLGWTSANFADVHPTGWVHLEGPDYFVPSTRAFVTAPLPELDSSHRDDAGGVYATENGTIVRWDPFSQSLEGKAEHPEQSRLHDVNEDGALVYRDTQAGTPFGIEAAEILVVPFDGGEPWTIPERADGAWLLPGPAAIYTPAVMTDPVETRALHWIDEELQPLEVEALARISTSLPLDYDPIAHDLVFVVEDGERSGIWRAALP